MILSLSSFYTSKQWMACRQQIMASRLNDTGDVVCAFCGKPIVNSYDCIAHHKIPLTEANVNDYEISLNPNNIELVHHACHNQIHHRWCTYNRHVYIVCGSPYSGKSEYTLANALADDLIVDINLIYEAISVSRSNRVYSEVMQMYNNLIDIVKYRKGKWVNAWIMRTLPLPMERERLANLVNGELIHIDTPKEVCMARAGEHSEIVQQYWEKYVPTPRL